MATLVGVILVIYATATLGGAPALVGLLGFALAAGLFYND